MSERKVPAERTNLGAVRSAERDRVIDAFLAGRKRCEGKSTVAFGSRYCSTGDAFKLFQTILAERAPNGRRRVCSRGSTTKLTKETINDLLAAVGLPHLRVHTERYTWRLKNLRTGKVVDWPRGECVTTPGHGFGVLARLF